ncbi:MAG: hypothetical protein C5B43_00400 [Verrucomicrobia bacterium]|nr:MAG: hypothetical protein C5B43_00400 [Verrucomicrobiota bacterium]
MELVDDRDAVQRKIDDAIATNNKSLKEISKLNVLIEESKQKKELLFQDFGITKEFREQNLSVSDLSTVERRYYDLLEREFLAELNAKGIDLNLEGKQTKTKTKVGVSMARKRLKI